MKLGLFGGSFDPPHNAHLFIAEAARVALDLDRVIFLPTRNARHRAPLTAATAHRVAMVRAAIATNVAFALDESDCREDATGYTADLLPRLRLRYPDDAFTFIVGNDSLIRSRWHRLDEIFEHVETLAIAPRIVPKEAGDGRALLDAFLATLTAEHRAKIRLLDLPPLTESATTVREQLNLGGSIRYLVPEPVYRYIDERNLYRANA